MKSNKQRNYFVKVHRPLSRRHQQQRIHLIWVIVLLFWLIQRHNFLLWYDLLKGLLESDSQLLIREFATIFILSSILLSLLLHSHGYGLCVHTSLLILFFIFLYIAFTLLYIFCVFTLVLFFYSYIFSFLIYCFFICAFTLLL